MSHIYMKTSRLRRGLFFNYNVIDEVTETWRRITRDLRWSIPEPCSNTTSQLDLLIGLNVGRPNTRSKVRSTRRPWLTAAGRDVDGSETPAWFPLWQRLSDGVYIDNSSLKSGHIIFLKYYESANLLKRQPFHHFLFILSQHYWQFCFLNKLRRSKVKVGFILKELSDHRMLDVLFVFFLLMKKKLLWRFTGMTFFYFLFLFTMIQRWRGGEGLKYDGRCFGFNRQ